jgi:hypothetical protein
MHRHRRCDVMCKGSIAISSPNAFGNLCFDSCFLYLQYCSQHCKLNTLIKVPMTRNFTSKGLWLYCKDHLKWLNNLFYRILLTCSLFKIFNFVSYANITGVTSHHIMSFQKSVVFLTNTYLENLKIALVYVLIS